jgi:GxxExxY protein
LPLGFRADRTVIQEVKVAPALPTAHDKQLQTWLRLSNFPAGLLFNFHTLRLKDGLRRFIG